VPDDVDEPIAVVDWCEDWPRAADALIAECRAALVGESFEVEHIGSTAVPGLVAKPVIDILIGVVAGRRAAVAHRLAAAGWTHLGEAGVTGREYLRRRAGQQANIHVVDRASALWDDNLLLRDYLRRDGAARLRYAEAKRDAAQPGTGLLDYSQRKAPAVAALLMEAKRVR
jgi:GrpB-like predicted nucleotidyltransferase (UPF0157 family)